MRARFLFPLLLGCSLGLSPALADQATRDGVALDRQFSVNGEELTLFGYGTARYARVFKVYVAGLYAPGDVAPNEMLDKDVTRRLEIEYLRDIAADDINEATDQLLRRQLDEETYAAVKDRFDYFAGLYQDIDAGDRYAFEYVPGEGGTLYFNGEKLGSVEGEDFARAYFGMWIGDDPMSAGLKRDLLGTR